MEKGADNRVVNIHVSGFNDQEKCIFGRLLCCHVISVGHAQAPTTEVLLFQLLDMWEDCYEFEYNASNARVSCKC